MARKILNTTPDPELVAAIAALRAAPDAEKSAAESRVLAARCVAPAARIAATHRLIA